MSEGKTIRLPNEAAAVSPVGVAYQRALEARRNKPEIGGGPSPPIPRLDQDPDPRGLPMSAQARQPSIVQPQNMPGAVPMPAGNFAGLTSNDMLPPEARQDPEYMPGMGSDLAVNSPRLAYKYGVIRKGQKIPPQMLQQPAQPQMHGGVGAIRPGGKTTQRDVEGLEELAKLQKKVDDHVSEDAKAEKESKEGLGGSAARLADEPKESVTPKMVDDLDFDTFRQLITKDILNNPEQKEIIEGRVQPMDITDLIVDGYVRQIVPIIPGKFEPEYQSITGEDQIGIKRMIMMEAKSLDVPEGYLMDKNSIMSIAAGLYAVNRRVLPTHRDKEGHFDEKLFIEKFNLIVRYPMHMLASLGLNFFWFDARVRKMFMAERLGNG